MKYEKLGADVQGALRERGLKSALEVFEELLLWEGIVGYTEKLWRAVESIHRAGRTDQDRRPYALRPDGTVSGPLQQPCDLSQESDPEGFVEWMNDVHENAFVAGTYAAKRD